MSIIWPAEGTIGIINMPHSNTPLPIVHWASTHQQQPSHSLNLKPHEIDLIPSWYCCWCYILKPCSQQAKGDCFDLAEKWVLTYFCWNTRLLSEEMTECLFRGSRSNASKCSVGFPISFANLFHLTTTAYLQSDQEKNYTHIIRQLWSHFAPTLLPGHLLPLC